MDKIEAQWRAEDDLRTLQSYHELKKDKKRMKAAKVQAKKQLAALQEAAAS